MSRIGGEHRVFRWMIVTSVFTGVVCFVVIFMLLYKQA